MRLSARRLNRTLLQRQHLLERVPGTVADVVGHLVGLQAQDTQPPYLSLAARLEHLEPEDVSRGLEDRSLVRLVTLRGTVHLSLAADAGALRAWVQPLLERLARTQGSVVPARGVDRTSLDDAVRDALSRGPLSSTDLAAALATTFDTVPPLALGALARLVVPLVQVPPRGCWGRAGGVVLEPLDRWTGRSPVEPDEPDVPDLVRRYLRAHGPATAADLTTWSGVTRLAPVLRAMADLVRHEDEHGRVLHDVADAPLAEEDAPAPVRLLGRFDNLWLSHAGRDRVTSPEGRALWAGPNGGVGPTLFADGVLVGLWRIEAGRVVLGETLRPLSRGERSDLDDEITRVEELLAR